MITKEQDEQLCKDFPLLYADRHGDMRNTCMCWGFDIGQGWLPLLRDVSSKLEKLIQEYVAQNHDLDCRWCGNMKSEHGEDGKKLLTEDAGKETEFGVMPTECHGPNGYEMAHPRASQVKSKFASLRLYMTDATEDMYTLIRDAEVLSYQTCEECGAPGKQCHPKGNWVWTLCPTCFDKMKTGDAVYDEDDLEEEE